MSRVIVRIFTSHKKSFRFETTDILIYPIFIGECTLFFLANILTEVQNANLLLQRNYTTGVSIIT